MVIQVMNATLMNGGVPTGAAGGGPSGEVASVQQMMWR
jgi:hypothetical protein